MWLTEESTTEETCGDGGQSKLHCWRGRRWGKLNQTPLIYVGVLLEVLASLSCLGLRFHEDAASDGGYSTGREWGDYFGCVHAIRVTRVCWIEAYIWCWGQCWCLALISHYCPFNLSQCDSRVDSHSSNQCIHTPKSCQRVKPQNINIIMPLWRAHSEACRLLATCGPSEHILNWEVASLGGVESMGLLLLGLIGGLIG